MLLASYILDNRFRGLLLLAMEVGSNVLLARQWRWPCFEAPFGSLSVRLDRCGGVRKPFGAITAADWSCCAFTLSMCPFRQILPFSSLALATDARE